MTCRQIITAQLVLQFTVVKITDMTKIKQLLRDISSLQTMGNSAAHRNGVRGQNYIKAIE